MARAKTARQIAASRKNIKKAQMVSARKRRGTGKPKVRHGNVSRGHEQKGPSKKSRAIRAGVGLALAGAYGYYHRETLAEGVRSTAKLYKHFRNNRANPSRSSFAVSSSGIATRTARFAGTRRTNQHQMAVVVRGMNRKRRLDRLSKDIKSGKIKVVHRKVNLKFGGVKR